MTAIGTATNAVQAASVARLKGNAPFMVMIQGIFDQAAVPVNQPFPYVTIGDPVENPMNCMGTVGARGYECIMTFHCWSQARGFKTVQTIMGQITALLFDRQPLSLPGQSHVGTWFLTSTAVEDPDGITQHGVVRLLFRVQEEL